MTMSDRWDLPSLIIGAALGAVAVGALALRSGESMAQESARIVAACAAQCEAADLDARAECAAAHDATEAATVAHAAALTELATRCVLSLPASERLRSAKVRREPVIDVWHEPDADGPDAD
jgi:hypothetical protein